MSVLKFPPMYNEGAFIFFLENNVFKSLNIISYNFTTVQAAV